MGAAVQSKVVEHLIDLDPLSDVTIQTDHPTLPDDLTSLQI